MKMLMKGMTVAILLAGLMSFTAQATVFTQLATQDTSLKPYKVNNNYNGTGWGFRVSDENPDAAIGGDVYTGIVGGFTLPDLGGENLVSATLRLETINPAGSWLDPDGNGTVEIGAYRLGSAWDETTATWNTPSPGWGAPGVAGTASTPVDIQLTTHTPAVHWEEWNVTTDVADMYANIAPNYGWMLQVENPGDGRIWFNRHENGEAGTAQLVIETAPIPEPGSLFLLGTGLLSLVSFVRRKRS
ncbi:MAG: PEP-CTERM sorting domain-containing protein [Nitrospirae bacterium]|nr:PEP-CTERM sorting domain-containing protein [Nitrospirota bacterium]